MDKDCPRHEDWLKNHEKRIGAMEQTDVLHGEQIKQLCKQLEDLVCWIRALIKVLIMAGIGIIAWFIQQIGTWLFEVIAKGVCRL